MPGIGVLCGPGPVLASFLIGVSGVVDLSAVTVGAFGVFGTVNVGYVLLWFSYYSSLLNICTCLWVSVWCVAVIVIIKDPTLP